MVSLKDKISSMFIIGFKGTFLEDEIKKSLESNYVGGVILFDKDILSGSQKRNIVDPDQIRLFISEIKAISKNDSLFVAVDYEGGQASNLRPENGFPNTQSALKVASLAVRDRQAEFNLMADTLKTAGFNLVFAPVVDLDKADNMLRQCERMYSSDPWKVVEVSQLFIEVMKLKQIVTCLKHFPGHGSANGDTHFDLVDVSETWQRDELLPYQVLIENDFNHMIMTAHVINNVLDNSECPATFSKEMITVILKEQLGFKGVVIADDIQMSAISEHYGIHDTLIKAINAGCDMLICSNQWSVPVTVEQLVSEVVKAIEQKEIQVSRIDDAFNRIQLFKSYI